MSELYAPEKCIDCKRRLIQSATVDNLEQQQQALATEAEAIEIERMSISSILLALARAGQPGPNEKRLQEIETAQEATAIQIEESTQAYTSLVEDCNGPVLAYAGREGIYPAFVECGSPILPRNATRPDQSDPSSDT
ncbi:MAG TPA: hypothetical protein VH144_03490 [Candidatus Saccharimonadales bacterium]|jgi:hypothetical protein|nr:hypothetical protein [Candidatus Saccharimonadales bacterium]